MMDEWIIFGVGYVCGIITGVVIVGGLVVSSVLRMPRPRRHHTHTGRMEKGEHEDDTRDY